MASGPTQAYSRCHGGVLVFVAVLFACLLAPAPVFAQRANTLTLTKTTSTPTFMAAGDVLHYQYDIRNDGPDPIPSGSSVFVDDDKVDILGSVSCRSIVGDLLVGDSVQCVGSYTVTSADVTTGSVTNTAQAYIDTCGDGCYVYSNTDQATSVLVTGSISLDKSTTTPTFTKAGDILSYSYLVTNTGSSTITDQVSVNDNLISSVSCPPPGAGLSPGNSITCTASYIVTASDVSGRLVTNTAQATAGLLMSNKDSVTVNLVAAPALSLDKTTTTTNFTAVGDKLAYGYQVTNSGNTTLTGSITISDDKIGSFTCKALPVGGLAPGGAVNCSRSYSVTQTDIDAGSVTNTAQAFDGAVASNKDSVTIDAVLSPALSLDKTTTTTNFTAVGDKLAYGYQVTNSGNTTLTGSITISDDKIGSFTCKALPVGGLAPGGAVNCSRSYSVTQTDIDAGSVTNTAQAFDGAVASNKDSVTIDAVLSPALSLDKTTTTTNFTAVGDKLAYGYQVTNSGNTTLTGSITISDDKIGSFTCKALPVGGLAPGGAVNCSRSYSVTQTDIDAGSVTNTAQAFDGAVASNKDSVTIDAVLSPALSLDKTTTTPTYKAAGDVLKYRYLVTNTGNTTLTGSITVSDNRIAAVACPALPAGRLVPGESITCSGSDTASQADVDAGKITNIATAHNGGLGSNRDSVTVDSIAVPALSLDKQTSTPSFAHVGDVLQYTYLVSNAGAVTITAAITVSDDRIASVACPALPAGGLAPGESITCSGSDTAAAADVVAGKITNTAIAHAGSVASNKDSVTVTRNNAIIIRDTQQKIKQFIYRRLDLILSNEPDRNRYIRRLTGSLWGHDDTTEALDAIVSGRPVDFAVDGQAGQKSLSISTSLSQMAAANSQAEQKRIESLGGTRALGKDTPAARKSDFDVWAEGHITFFDDSLGNADFSGHLGILYLGADYLVSPSVLIGALVQLDWFKENSKILAFKGNGFGWMAGPYMSTKLSPHLFFDARAAWGRSNNTIDPFGIYTDNFNTGRWLARANLTGNWNAGNWRFTPSAAITYMAEYQDSYNNALGLKIPGQTVSLGQFTFGPEVAYRILLDDGTSIEPHASLTGVWSFAHPKSLNIGGTSVAPDELRARIEAGIMVQAPNGTGFRATVDYDGIGSSLNAITGKLWLNIPLN